MANGNIDDIKHNIPDLLFWNTDVSVEPAVLTFGTKGRDASGNWRYTLISGDGAPLVRSDDAGLMRVSSVGSAGTVSLSADASGNRVSAFSNDAGLMRVSAVGGSTVSLSADASGNRVSAVQADAGLLHVSAIGTLTVSAHEVKQSDAASLRVSARSDDAGLFRVSALGVTVTTSPLSADSSSISAKQADAGNLHVSSFIDSGSVSAKSSVADNFRTSAFSNDAALFRVSALGVTATSSPLSADSSSVSAKQGDAGNLRISARSDDAGLFRVSALGVSVTTSPLSADSSSISAKQGDAANLRISARSDDAGLFRVSALGVTATSSPLSADSSSVSAKQGDAGLLRTSSFVDSGSISAKSGDAGQFLVSAQVFGNIASGATDSGNPVKVGAKYNATKPTFTDGQRGDLQITTRGSLQATLFVNDSTLPIVGGADNADGVVVTTNADKLSVRSRNTVFNGNSWDRMYGDVSGTWVKLPDFTTSAFMTAIGDSLSISAIGKGNLGAQLSGTWTGTVAFQGTIDESNWFPVFGIDNSTNAIVSSTTTSRNVFFEIAGLRRFRLSSTAAMTGTLSAFMDSTQAGGDDFVTLKQDDAAYARISALVSDASLFRVSALNQDANLMHVSAVGTVTVSAHEVKQSDAASLLVSAKSGDANQVHVSAVQGDAALLHVSAIGTLTVSAHEVKQSDASSLLVSAKQGDAGLLLVSGKQGDAGLFRVSSSIFPDTTGGLTTFSNFNVSTSQTIKSTAGAVYGWYAWNNDSKPNWINLYNTSGAINVGTDAIKVQIYLPASAAANVIFPIGLAGFTNGIGVASVSAAVSTATTAGAASAIGLNLFYK